MNRKTRLDFVRTHLKKSLPSFWTDETKMMEKEKSGEGKEQLLTQSTTSCIKHGGDSVMTWSCMVANGTDSLLLFDDVIADINIRINSEVYRTMLSLHAPIVIGRSFTV